ncbi:hypothetical protein SCLCIDRAFT_1208375 [Scleroderma citrinum Foug A]|uniref:Uncharacterized protein n=1 Tax=Scleroderma citrinum Foug A TaxID=1036808 RepID=A0A0C3A7Z4_9AGAM|nr:hypothetical protein SCLCIDRAFT_1208375 [Scleroderma citrinum Foug A]
MLSNISKEELLVGVLTSVMVCLSSSSCSSKSPQAWIKYESAPLRTVLPKFDPGPGDFPELRHCGRDVSSKFNGIPSGMYTLEGAIERSLMLS